MFKSLVRSQLEYANSVWCPFKVGLIENIEKVQRRATKLVGTCRGLSYEDRLKFLKLPTLKCRRMRDDMIHVYKILHNVCDDKDTAPSLQLLRDSNTRDTLLT